MILQDCSTHPKELSCSPVTCGLMDDRSAKRQRQLENRSDTTCYISGANGGGGTSTKQIPAGCYLEIRSATSHIFLGQPVEVEVRLLNDEDVVQPTTVGINATVMSEDEKVTLVAALRRRRCRFCAWFSFPRHICSNFWEPVLRFFCPMLPPNVTTYTALLVLLRDIILNSTLSELCTNSIDQHNTRMHTKYSIQPVFTSALHVRTVCTEYAV